MVLGVHKKSSRLGVLGELGRYPLFIKGLCHVLKYHAHLNKIDNKNSIIGKAVDEMKATNSNNNSTWWGRIETIKKSLCLKYSYFSKLEAIDLQIKKGVKSKFQLYWLKLINYKNIGVDGKNHNKLRFYAKLKGCFQKEPYIDLVPNRAQRADLTRLRISSSRLAVETMRYQRPYVPAEQRYCSYCRPMGDNENQLQGFLDDEYHLLAHCGTFMFKRNCFLSRYELLHSGIKDMSTQDMVHTILCPTTTTKAKLINKYIKILFETRKQLDEGFPILNSGYEGGIAVNPFFDTDNDIDYESP